MASDRSRPAAASAPDADPDARPALSSLYESDPVYPPEPHPAEVERTRALPAPPAADVNLDVPHVHQLWDTPDDFRGGWACGAASCTMVLAYYGLLEPRPITCSHPDPHESPYGWYVSNAFTKGGRTFDATSGTPDGSAAGIYGAVLDRIGGGWGAHWHSERGRGIAPLMAAFLPPVGNRVRIKAKPKASGIFLERASAEAALVEALDAGHPLIVSGRFTFHGKRYDHLLVVRGYYRESGSGELQWIVNDPYGFETDRSYDGANVVYTFAEIQPKWMAVFGGEHVPARPEPSDHVPVRLFDRDTNAQVGEGTLIRGTDKVYIKRLDEAP